MAPLKKSAGKANGLDSRQPNRKVVKPQLVLDLPPWWWWLTVFLPFARTVAWVVAPFFPGVSSTMWSVIAIAIVILGATLSLVQGANRKLGRYYQVATLVAAWIVCLIVALKCDYVVKVAFGYGSNRDGVIFVWALTLCLLLIPFWIMARGILRKTCVDGQTLVSCPYNHSCLPTVDEAREARPSRAYEGVPISTYSAAFDEALVGVKNEAAWKKSFERDDSRYPAVFVTCEFSPARVIDRVFSAIQEAHDDYTTHKDADGGIWDRFPEVLGAALGVRDQWEAGKQEAYTYKSICLIVGAAMELFSHFEAMRKCADAASKALRAYCNEDSKRNPNHFARLTENRVVRVLLAKRDVGEIWNAQDARMVAAFECLVRLTHPGDLYVCFTERVLGDIDSGIPLKPDDTPYQRFPVTDFGLFIREGKRGAHPFGEICVFDFYDNSRILLTVGQHCRRIPEENASGSTYAEFHEHWLNNRNNSAYYLHARDIVGPTLYQEMLTKKDVAEVVA